jgi:hypothetical protein
VTSPTERFEAILDEVRAQEAVEVRDDLARSILIGPYDDRGIAEPGKERGDGFAIYIGTWRLGWWATREEACDVGQLLGAALRGHPTERDQRRARRARRT